MQDMQTMAKKPHSRAGQKKLSAERRPRKKAPTQATPVTDADPDWKLFVAAYKEQYPALAESAVYALPERLIKAVEQHVPGFFLPDDLIFERNLTRLGGAGFFQGRPFVHPLLEKRQLDPREAEAWKVIDDSSRQAIQRIEEMLDAGMRDIGRSPAQIRQFHRERKKFDARSRLRQMSYLGWLLTNPCFQSERVAFFNRCGPDMDKFGSLRLPLSFVGDLPQIPEEFREMYDEMLSICRRWCIEGFETRDLPIPLQPQITSPALHHLPSIAAGGMLIFVPWYLLRDKDFKLYELLDLQLLSKDLSHLAAWLSGDRKWGHTRFPRMFELYMYLELGLKRRYPDRMQGKTERLDLAFRDFFSDRLEVAIHGTGMDEESVRKTRLEMNRRLRGERLAGPTPQDG
jgi:hypothetical protein